MPTKWWNRFSLTFGVGLLACGVVMVMLLAQVVRADAAKPTWSDENQSIVVSNGDTISDDDYSALRNKVAGLYTKLKCTVGSEQAGDCWYETSAGRIAQGGQQLQLDGMDVPGYIVDKMPDSENLNDYNPQIQTVVPTPDDNVFLQLSQDSDNGQYHVYFRTTANMKVSRVQNPWGAPFYIFDTPVTNVPELNDAAGKPLLTDWSTLYNNTTYSTDGHQMALYNPSGEVTMVDLRSLTVRTIHVPDAPDDGSTPFAIITPSNDGNYLAVSIPGGDLGIYDLQLCDAAMQTLQVCHERALGIALAIATGDRFDYPLGGGVPQFIDSDLLEYTLADSMPSGHFQYYLRAPNTEQTNYIALGDSYASGEGAGNSNFFPETNVSGVNQCHLSPLSYPFLIAGDLQLQSNHSVACSGARIADILTSKQYKAIPSNNTLGAWLPGPTPQIEKVTKHTNIVTISGVGNDVGFGDIVQRCIMESDTCYSTYEDRKELVLLINKQYDRLVDMYTQLKHSASPDAHIYVIGYPEIVNPGGNCGDNVKLNYSETVFAHDLIDYLDSVIQKAANRVGVYYVSDSTALNGHRLCDQSVQKAVNGITIAPNGNSWTNNSFHPNLYGHELLAKWVESMTYDFTTSMPRSNLTENSPVVDDSLPILQAPKTGRPLNELNYDNDMTNNIVYRGKVSHMEYYIEKGIKAAGGSVVKGYGLVKGWIHSDPIYIGSFEADSDGNFSTNVTIPGSVPVGFHTLDFYAEGVDGQMQDIRKTIYVAASPDDYDGDGVPNVLEPCLFFEVPNRQLIGDDYDCSAEAATNSVQASIYSEAQSSNDSKRLSVRLTDTNAWGKAPRTKLDESAEKTLKGRSQHGNILVPIVGAILAVAVAFFIVSVMLRKRKRQF